MDLVPATGTATDASSSTADASTSVQSQTAAQQTVADPLSGASANATTVPPFTVDPTALQRIGITTTPVVRRSLESEIRAVGHVEYNERKVKVVSARVDGRIERLLVDFTGAKVRKGQSLLELYSPQLLSSQQDYLLARDERSASPGNNGGSSSSALAQAALGRLKLWGVTSKQLASLEKTGQAVPSLSVLSPISGSVVEKAGALEGAYVKEGDVLYKIADLSSVWVLADIYERDLARIGVGTQATVQVPSLTEPLTGKVVFVYPEIAQATRTARVRIPLENPGEKLLPGMTVDAVLTPSAGEALMVPSTAVIRTGPNAVAYVKVGANTFQPRLVRLGIENGDFVEVLSGLNQGEEVVTSGAFLLDSQTQLTGGQSALWSGATEVEQASAPAAAATSKEAPHD